MHAIEIKNLSFAYRTPILKNISLTVNEGEYINIIGPNGAGKSTLVKCITNILPSEKHIKIFGKYKENYTDKDLAKTVSYIPQASNIHINFTCKEFIYMSRYPYFSINRSLTEEDISACEYAMEITDTKKFADRQIDELSGGEKQTVLIAAGIAQKTKIILLDEPCAFLDPFHTKKILDILNQINRYATVILVSHDLNTLKGRIISIKDGSVFSDTSCEEFMNLKLAEKIFNTEFEYPLNKFCIIKQ